MAPNHLSGFLYSPSFLVDPSEGHRRPNAISDPIQSSMEEAMDDAEDVSWCRGSDSLSLRIGAAAAVAACCSFSCSEATLLFPAAALPLKSETCQVPGSGIPG